VIQPKRFHLVLASALSLVVVLAPQSTYAATDDYPSRLRDAPQDSINPDDWQFMNRECTSFVAWRMVQNNGFKEFNNYITGKGEKRLSDASKWGVRAQAAGYTVDITPAKGAVAWWPSGHVAWVESIDTSKGKVTIEDYNHHRDGKYDRRTLNIHKDIDLKKGKFIHFKDIQDSTPKTSNTVPSSSKPAPSQKPTTAYQLPAPSSSKADPPLSSYAGDYSASNPQYTIHFKFNTDGTYSQVVNMHNMANYDEVTQYGECEFVAYEGYTEGVYTSVSWKLPNGTVPAGSSGWKSVGDFCAYFSIVSPGVLATPAFGSDQVYFCTSSVSNVWKQKCGL
jgi:surface antigen